MKTINKQMLTSLVMIMAVVFLAGCSLSIDPEAERVQAMSGAAAGYTSESGYVDVNGLSMYYEVHGEGDPLVLLHGGLTTIDVTLGTLIPSFAQNRQVIAV